MYIRTFLSIHAISLALAYLTHGCRGYSRQDEVQGLHVRRLQEPSRASALATLLLKIKPASALHMSTKGLMRRRPCRRSVLGYAASSVFAPTSSLCAYWPAAAYDAIPVEEFSASTISKRIQEREAKAKKSNKEADALLAKVQVAANETQYDDAMSQLTLWIIGTGPPLPQFGAGAKGDIEGPLPAGFRTRELVATCKRVKDALPRFRQKAGEVVIGLPECVETRERSDCLSAGPLAEIAFRSMMVELEKRAPRQYDVNAGSALLKTWLY